MEANHGASSISGELATLSIGGMKIQGTSDQLADIIKRLSSGDPKLEPTLPSKGRSPEVTEVPSTNPFASLRLTRTLKPESPVRAAPGQCGEPGTSGVSHHRRSVSLDARVGTQASSEGSQSQPTAVRPKTVQFRGVNSGMTAKPSTTPGGQLPKLDEENYLDSLNLFNEPLWPSFAPFVCPLCSTNVGMLEGVLMKSCMVHRFCRPCLVHHVQTPIIGLFCPASGRGVRCARITTGEIDELIRSAPGASRPSGTTAPKHTSMGAAVPSTSSQRTSPPRTPLKAAAPRGNPDICFCSPGGSHCNGHAGRAPAEDESRVSEVRAPLVSDPSLTDPLVEIPPETEIPEESAVTADNYLFLLDLFEEPVWPTYSPFECPVCGVKVESLAGVVLKGCMIHSFCRPCMMDHIASSETRNVLCPLSKTLDPCGNVSDEEIKSLLTEQQWTKHQAKPTRAELENDPSKLQLFLMDRELLPNLLEVECPVCMVDIPAQEGVIPKNCLIHAFCKTCLVGAIKYSDIPLVQCPAADCEANLTDREVRLLVNDEDYCALQMKGVKRVLASKGNEIMHCKTPDCPGAWFIDAEGDGRFNCPDCNALNCSRCEALHPAHQTCASFQEDKRIKEANDQSEVESKAYLETTLRQNQAMVCPKCKALVSKIDGCDGMTCTVCRTELCWATKGPRWGPGGKGDNSGGCRCNFNGKKCAPNCQNCH